MKKQVAVALMCLANISIAAAAEPITDWTYVGVKGFVGAIDRDTDSFAATDIGLEGSFDLFDLVSIQADISSGEVRFAPTVETTAAGIGVAVHLPVFSRFNVYVPIQYRYLEADADGSSSESVSGYLVGLGLRGMGNQFFEYQAQYAYKDLGKENGIKLDDHVFNLLGRWHVNELFSFSIGLEAATETDRFGFTGDVRFSF